ncbi:MAG: hypothetical protein IKJ04_03805 [Clostridia bacterium]|nr:hypothetical protein [Clostridia bacterium]MBR4033910.1 hypothetical protein [Clostridia bacterium]
MPSLNHLYRTVYQTGTKKYDPDKRHYTIVLAANAPYEGFFDSMEQNLKLRMNDDTVSVVNRSEENPNETRLRIRDIRDNLYEQYYEYESLPMNFVLIDYIKDGSPEEYRRVAEFREWIGDMNLRPADKIFVIYVLRGDKDAVDLAKTIPSVAYEDVHFYWFTLASDASEVKKTNVLNSICGSVILNSFPEQFTKHDQRRNNAVAEAEAFKKNLNESAAGLFAPSEKLIWSSLHCRFFDRKMDFLAWCSYNLCDKMKRLDKSIVMESFRQLYKNNVREGSNRDETKAALLFAIKMIPTVEPPPKKKRNESNSLKGHFERLYGHGGEKIVELSLKMTYASLQSSSTMPPLQICAQKLYNECKRYYTEDLHTTIHSALEEYIENELRPMLDQKERSLHGMLNQGEIDEEMLFHHYENKQPIVSDYIGKYIEVYEFHKELDFWVNMSHYLMAAKEELAKLAQESTAVLNEIAAFKQFCKESMVPIEDTEHIVFEECSIDDIQAFIAGKPSAAKHYEVIRRAFKETASARETHAVNHLNDVVSLPLIHNIYCDVDVSFEHDTYSIRGFERNGKYMIFGD